MREKLFYSLVLILTLAMIGCQSGESAPGGADTGKANPKHSWTFNDGTAKDKVGGAEGTLMGGAVIEGGALVTSQPGQWMRMPAGALALNAYKEVTIEAWFTSAADANTGYHMLAYFGDTVNGQGSDCYFMTPARGDDKSRAAITCGVTENPWTGESGANGSEYDDGKPHHLVSTLNAKEITLYIDGQLTGSTPLADNNSIAGISPKFAFLAKSGYEADPTWMGKILEFNIYNQALSAGEILSLYKKGAAAD